MNITGQQVIPQPQTVTWAAITDPEVLQGCIPGCDGMEKVSDSEYRVLMSAKVGPVSAKFRGRILLADMDAPNAYTLRFEGEGGVAGFAKGEARVTLTPDGEKTTLSYSAQASIGGKLAQLGARLIDGVARKMAEQFFTGFNVRLSATSGSTTA